MLELELATLRVYYICVLILRYMCPHTALHLRLGVLELELGFLRVLLSLVYLYNAYEAFSY